MIKKSISFIILFCFIETVTFGQPQLQDPLFSFRSLASGGQTQEALRVLQELFNAEKNPQIKAKMAFGLGVLSYNDQKKDQAAQFLGQALALNTRLDDYAQFYLGLIERDGKDWNGAKQHFTFVQNHVPKSIKAVEAEIELAHIASNQEKWGQAFLLMTRVERRYRHDPNYPDILFDMTEISGALKKRADQCRYAVKLYSRFPSYALSKGWPSDFSQVKVHDVVIKCSLTQKDRERHLNNLLVAGEFDQVRNELKDWSNALSGDKSSRKEVQGKIELMQGQLSLAEGKVKEAIGHFTNVLTSTGKNFAAQMFLARAYSLTDDYGRAVEGYLRAYEMSPRSKLGQKALFQAAFLSYQNRDYDGAARHFEDVSKKTKGRVAWDSRWHLAWIRYLEADYEGAIKEFSDLARDRRNGKGVELEKITFWHGMSEYRLGNIEPARALFTQLATEKRMGYYTAAAQARLKILPTSSSPAITSSPLSSPSGSPSPSVTPASTTGLKLLNQSNRLPASQLENVVEPAPEHGGITVEKEKLDTIEKPDEEDQTPEALAEYPPITSLKNSGLLERFDRAQDLIDLGFEPWARAELYEIERRTSNRTYLQTLMAEYHKAGDFFRSATIADLVFEDQRDKGGLEGAAQLWMYAFPQAYIKAVNAACKKFDVSRSLTEGIIRGESGYREEIHSSAGALGLMQLIPPTAKKVAKDLGFPTYTNSMLLTADTNILFGVRYLKRLNKTMGNNLPLTIASYNAGPHRVQGWLKDFGGLDLDEFIEHIPYLETRNYVKKVLRNYFIYESLYEKKTGVLDWLARKPTIKFDGPKPTSESWEE